MLVRIMYGKPVQGRFLSHLDLMHAWERAIRRTGAPLAFSQGYNPHPKLAFGSALSVGTISDGEYMDVELTEEVSLAEFRQSLVNTLPPALTLLDIAEIPAKSDALMSMINRAAYEVTVSLSTPLDQAALTAIIEKALAQTEIKVLRFKKNSKDKREVDIRSGIVTLEGTVIGEREILLSMLVQTGSEGNVRAAEVVMGLMQAGLPVVEDILQVHRKGLYVLQGEKLVSPMVCGLKM